ncbi:MAG: hypothetical protein ABWY96_00460, partial [Gaiellaceae bacterium]
MATPCRANALSAVDLPAPIPPVIATATGRFPRVVVRLAGGLALGRDLVRGGSLVVIRCDGLGGGRLLLDLDLHDLDRLRLDLHDLDR